MSPGWLELEAGSADAALVPRYQPIIKDAQCILADLNFEYHTEAEKVATDGKLRVSILRFTIVVL